MLLRDFSKDESEHLAAALLHMGNAKVFLKGVDWTAAIRVCGKDVKRDTFKNHVNRLVNSSSLKELNEVDLQRLAASLLHMDDVDSALARVSWAKASASASPTARHPVKEVGQATVTRLVRGYRAADDVQFLGERIVIPDDSSDDDEGGALAPGPQDIVDSTEDEDAEIVDDGNAANNVGPQAGLTRSTAPSVESDASDEDSLFVSER